MGILCPKHVRTSLEEEEERELRLDYQLLESVCTGSSLKHSAWCPAGEGPLLKSRTVVILTGSSPQEMLPLCPSLLICQLGVMRLALGCLKSPRESPEFWWEGL